MSSIKFYQTFFLGLIYCSGLILSACGQQGFEGIFHESTTKEGFRSFDPRGLSPGNNSRADFIRVGAERSGAERWSQGAAKQQNQASLDIPSQGSESASQKHTDSKNEKGKEPYFNIPVTSAAEVQSNASGDRGDSKEEEAGQEQENFDQNEHAVDPVTGIQLKFIASRGTLIPSIYYIPSSLSGIDSCDPADMRLILSPQGDKLGEVCKPVYDECELQGSCLINFNGVVRLFNIHSLRDNKSSFFEVKTNLCRFGYGVQMSCLDPFYTLAADLKIYNPGDVIFIPHIVGVKLPNGSTHTGYFIIRDHGRAIKGPGRFDFFTGFYHWRSPQNPFTKLGLGNKKERFQYVRVQGELAEQIRRARNYPRLPLSPQKNTAPKK